jgi:hypothetical protein
VRPYAAPLRLGILLLLAGGLARPALAQTPQVPPAGGYSLHEQAQTGRFTVQRWVSETSPEVSPAGFCECITLVYEGERLILDLGLDVGLTHVYSSEGDVTGDGRPELVVNQNSGGAHCCDATTIYSVETELRSLLSVTTNNCTGRLVDLDADGVDEFETCDDTFAYEFCSFGFSPMPTVVFAYDRTAGAFTLATPRFAQYGAQQRQLALADARQTMRDYPEEPEIVRCAALGPALSLIYSARIDEGRALFRTLYTRPDGTAIEERAINIAINSPFWVAR